VNKHLYLCHPLVLSSPTTAADCVTVSVLVCAVSTDGTLETRTLFYPTNIVCNFHPIMRRECGRFVKLATFVRSTERNGKDGHLMNQYRCDDLLIFGAAAQYRYSAVRGNV